MDKQNQTHLDRSIRESVPMVLDNIGMHEVAARFRGLPEISNPYRIEMAQGMLTAILPEILKSGKDLPGIIRAGSPEVVKEAQAYLSGLVTARAVVEAAWDATRKAVHGGLILN